MICELDHLVLAARTLEEGVAWCEATLGITPGPGGKHPLMGTHNRLFAIGSAAFPRAYFEVIAIDPDAPWGSAAPHGRSEGAGSPSGGRRVAPWGSDAAPHGRSEGAGSRLEGRLAALRAGTAVALHHARWFDLDDAALNAALAQGPQLVHWVARTDALDAATAALAMQGIDAGPVRAASRTTPQGELRWRIAVPDDGARRFAGALPLLIEWGAVHPSDALPASGVTLSALALGAPDPATLGRALKALGLPSPAAGAPALRATLNTPRGSVTLCCRA